jgi:hypothetical protein
MKLSHFNYDEFAPKRHFNKKKIADILSTTMKDRLMKVEEHELDNIYAINRI